MEAFVHDLEESCAKFQNVKNSLKEMMKVEHEPHAQFKNEVESMKTMMKMEDEAIVKSRRR
jgi:hypothetical protein